MGGGVVVQNCLTENIEEVCSIRRQTNVIKKPPPRPVWITIKRCLNFFLHFAFFAFTKMQIFLWQHDYNYYFDSKLSYFCRPVRFFFIFYFHPSRNLCFHAIQTMLLNDRSPVCWRTPTIHRVFIMSETRFFSWLFCCTQIPPPSSVFHRPHTHTMRVGMYSFWE